MKIKCPSCSSILSIADSAAGTVVRCQCGKSLRAPGQPVASAQPIASAAAPARRPAAPTAVDPGLFDDLSEGDLQPLKQVHRPGVSSNPYQPSSSVDDTQDGPYPGELASLGKRFLGAFLDQLIYNLAMAVAFVPSIFMGGGANEPPSDEFVMVALVGLALLVPVIINAVLITKSGQSIGKKAVGTRIVQDPSRQLPGFVKGVLMRSYLNGLLTIVPFYSLVDMLMIFGAERKCLHDRIASTIVINA